MFNNNGCCNIWCIIILLILFCGCGNNGFFGNNRMEGCCDNNCGCNCC